MYYTRLLKDVSYSACRPKHISTTVTAVYTTERYTTRDNTV